MANKVQERVDSLVAERESVIQRMQEAKKVFENCNVRLIQIEASINTLVELFKQSEEASDDTESEVNSESDINKE